MKADLITLHAVRNYGSVLQAYATQQTFEKFGVKINIINFIREDVLDKNIVLSNGGDNILKKIILYPSLMKQKKVFNAFNKKYLNLTEDKYTYDSDFNNYSSDADFFITGSDQVWNSTWNKGILLSLYLSFVKNKPKIAYSASFGKEYIDDEEIFKTQKYIDEYSFISVRENSGLNILKNQYNYKNAVQILDPTLIQERSFWEELAVRGKKYNKYVLIYQLNRNKDFDKYAKKVAKKMNCHLIRICRGYHQIILNGKSVVCPSVETFVSLFKNASLVITDSFHALSFSTNLNTPFICIYPPNFSTRLKSHLEMFGLEDRLLSSYDDFEIIDKDINWNLVNEKLNFERKKSEEFINKCLNFIKEKKESINND